VLENHFAQECDNNTQIKFYFKLPEWFTISTPVGNHNPGWAVVFESDKRNCFVVGLKNSGTASPDDSKPKHAVQMKTKCAGAHFSALEGLRYKVVSGVEELNGESKRTVLSLL
jgi:type III restriction enzyme